jgi:hypothetical protein
MLASWRGLVLTLTMSVCRGRMRVSDQIDGQAIRPRLESVPLDLETPIMNTTSFLVSSIICAAALAPAAQARLSAPLTSPDVNISATFDGLQSGDMNVGEAVTASGPKKLVATYVAIDTTTGAIPLLPGFTVLDTSAVNCPSNAPSCTIGFESMVQVMANGDIEAICLKVDNMVPICHNQTLVSDPNLPPAIVHAREAVENLAPGPHIVETLMKVVNGNSLFFFQTDYRVYKP